MASNMLEMPQLVELWAETGASGVHVEPLYQQSASADLTEHYHRENLESGGAARASKAFADAARRAKDLGVFFQSRLGANSREFDYVKRAVQVDWTCSEPWASIWITSAGEVRTCCTNEVAFGNLFEKSIQKIWRGDDFRRFRNQHQDRTQRLHDRSPDRVRDRRRARGVGSPGWRGARLGVSRRFSLAIYASIRIASSDCSALGTT